MLSYKEHIFLSIIDTVNLQESYNQGDTSFLEMLLEAPMDDKTDNKIIADKKRLSVYYQGDEKSKKGWYSIEPIRIDNKNGKNFILTYIIPKDGSKPVLQYLNQSKIVNWNVLGKKDAELPKEYEKKVLKFLSDPKIPKEIQVENVSFPIDIFPKEIQFYLTECATKLDSNIDFMGVSMLWLISVCIGNSFEIEFK
jgi:hypothetical protein